jgi:hypothetical protein
VGFFTSPRAKAPPAKPPSKPPKKVVTDSHTLPSTLVPARSVGSLVSASAQSPLASPSKSATTHLPSGLVPARKPSFTQPPATSPGVPRVSPIPTVAEPSDVKSGRTSTATATSDTPAVSGSKPTQNPRPAQPVKRPKQPPSLFIPKKVRPNRTS